MELPYVSSPAVAFATAQASTAVLLTALVSHRPLKSRAATVLVLCGIWLASLVVSALDWLPPMRVQLPVELGSTALDVASVLVVLAVLLERRWSLGGGGAFAALVLHRVGTYVGGSTYERAVLHVAFAALIYALAARAPDPSGIDPEGTRDRRRSEWIVFAAGLLAATFVAVYVLDRFVASGDEWGYQYQADLFAHGKLYGPVPECPSVHETYWIFYWMGRAFCQYTPSWPLVVAPFQRLGVYWLASPVVFAFGLVGVGRLARRAARGGDHDAGSASKEVRLAGILAPFLMGTSGAMLLNAGSLFSHVFLCTLYAWSLEALFTITSPGRTRRGEIAWGCALGSLVALLLGARPGDAVALIPGMAVYGVYSLVRGKVGRLSMAAAALSFALVGALILVILRAQIGAWFRTGYSLTDTFRPWGTIKFSWPTREEWKYGIPLATGAYCFWPCSIAVAAVGAARSYRQSRVLPLVLSAGLLLQFAFYAAVSGGRHYDWGYGPRYVLPTIVPLAIFGSVALAPLIADLGRRSRADLLRAVSAATAIVVGIGTIGALLYPMAMAEVRRNGAPYRAIRAAGLKHAVVVFSPDLIAQDPADLTQNLPSETNPDVVYLIERSRPEMKCARRLYADREWYRAEGYEEVELFPFD